MIKNMIKAVLPDVVRLWMWRQYARLKRPPPLGWRLFGSLRYLHPIRRGFGYPHGQCIDRYYIEDFLACHASDVQGCVLEIGDNTYTRRYGGERVSKSDVLFVSSGNPQATIVADLTRADNVPAMLIHTKRAVASKGSEAGWMRVKRLCSLTVMEWLISISMHY